MDPNETLRSIRDVIKMRRGRKANDVLVDLIEALDLWLSKGGFHPDDWSQQVDEAFERGVHAGQESIQ
jgi:hypothetical protein